MDRWVDSKIDSVAAMRSIDAMLFYTDNNLDLALLSLIIDDNCVASRYRSVTGYQ
jgi:hypothetical protein